MARAGGGASVPTSSYAALERTLERIVECLVTGTQTREARALLIEARRLRSVIANWRSIPPPGDVFDEMEDRVRQIATVVGAVLPDPIDEVTSVAQSTLPEIAQDSYDDEATEGYALDFEPRLYSLDTAPNRRALPLPAEAGRKAAGAIRAVLERAPISEEEPTRAWNNAALQPSADLEAKGWAPAPWPVEEPALPPRHTARTSVPPPASPSAPPAPGPSAPPAAAAPGLSPLAARPGAGRPSLLDDGPPLRQSSQPAQRPISVPPAAPPDEEAGGARVPSYPPRASYPPRIVTYDFETEGEEAAVPRTQITAHPVKLADPVNPLLVVLTDPYSPRTDAYRTLRRKLAAIPTARVLAVTSAQPGEGKTVFALNLALTLRESARGRVLLIEANLRSPIIAKMLGFSAPECFLAQLSRHAEDPRAPWVVAEPLPKLHVMAIDPQLPHEPLLDAVTFSMGMERIKQAGYDYVIVDSPPVLGSTDCNAISDAVDALILTALPMKSMRRQMRKAVEQLEPAPILGVVVLEA